MVALQEKEAQLSGLCTQLANLKRKTQLDLEAAQKYAIELGQATDKVWFSSFVGPCCH